MPLVSKSFSIDIVPGKIPSTIHVSEKDIGRLYYISIVDDGTPFSIPSGTTAKVEGTIGPYGFSENADIINNTVIVTLRSKMTAIKGKVWTKIKLSNNGDIASTCAFWLDVDKAGAVEGQYIDPDTGPDSAIKVSSVNGKTGVVVLKTSDLQNDSGYVTANQAAAAAPVKSVNGKTGVVTVNELPDSTNANVGDAVVKTSNGVEWGSVFPPSTMSDAGKVLGKDVYGNNIWKYTTDSLIVAFDSLFADDSGMTLFANYPGYDTAHAIATAAGTTMFGAYTFVDQNTNKVYFLSNYSANSRDPTQSYVIYQRYNKDSKLFEYATIRGNSNAFTSVTLSSDKGVWDTFQRKPVTVWEVQDVSQGLLALNTNISSNLAWQLTDLDMTPYKRIKIYSRAGRKTGTTAQDSSITPASIIEMSLDDRAKETVSQNVFIGSSVVQNPNDANHLGLLTCAVSADKTKFAVVRSTTLYGTAATSNTDAYTRVFLIEGYYD